jgi:MoaA/NifB/PqqE/SkfB family radical SAM enzyme
MPATSATSATSATLALIDASFRSGAAVTPAPPSRFYVSLTERCQLRCVHCLTGAPARTADGTARTLSEPVLAALRPHLRHAAYVGLTHAGEPLLAPLFETFLAALRAARAGEPTVVHLLTHGMALPAQRFLRLAALGVSSLSFSLDGLSATTNDALRTGSRAAVLLPRIREIAALRAERCPAVRLGLSWTVTRSNLGELPALLRFAREAGLDWVKLEEMFPGNAAATAAAPDRGATAAAVGGALELARALGVRLLDHTREVAVWKCRMAADPWLRDWSTRDDYANRMEINPCRLPYEVVCVEPNGDVRPVSFHHPVAGNLLARDLGEIWNSAPFAAARRALRERRLCGAGPATCSPDPGPEGW